MSDPLIVACEGDYLTVAVDGASVAADAPADPAALAKRIAELRGGAAPSRGSRMLTLRLPLRRRGSRRARSRALCPFRLAGLRHIGVLFPFEIRAHLFQDL